MVNALCSAVCGECNLGVIRDVQGTGPPHCLQRVAEGHQGGHPGGWMSQSSAGRLEVEAVARILKYKLNLFCQWSIYGPSMNQDATKKTVMCKKQVHKSVPPGD